MLALETSMVYTQLIAHTVQYSKVHIIYILYVITMYSNFYHFTLCGENVHGIAVHIIYIFFITPYC